MEGEYTLTKHDKKICDFFCVEELAKKLSNIFELRDPLKVACDLITDKKWRKKLGFKIVKKSENLNVCAFKNVETGEIIGGLYAFCSRKKINIYNLTSLFIDVSHVKVFDEIWEVGEVRWVDLETGKYYQTASEILRDIKCTRWYFQKDVGTRFVKEWFTYERRSN